MIKTTVPIMMRAATLAKAVVTFGLVTIPVKIHSAADRSKKIEFNMLHSKCGGRLEQLYRCKKDAKVLDKTEIIKGYEYQKDKYIHFTQEEINDLKPESDQRIEIVGFARSAEFDPLYLDKSYYLSADESNYHGYALLRLAMMDGFISSFVAVGKYKVRGQQHLVMVRPSERSLIMHQMFYTGEVKQLDDHVDLHAIEIDDEQVKMAKMLVSSMAGNGGLNLDQFHDEVQDGIQKAIENKIAGIPIKLSPARKEPVLDLTKALIESLKSTKQTSKSDQRTKRSKK